MVVLATLMVLAAFMALAARAVKPVSVASPFRAGAHAIHANRLKQTQTQTAPAISPKRRTRDYTRSRAEKTARLLGDVGCA